MAVMPKFHFGLVEPLDRANPNDLNVKVDPNAQAEARETITQPKITGYRQLNADEATMMNEAKALGAAAEELVKRLREYHRAQAWAAVNDDDELQRLDDAEPGRWLAMGRTDIQVGIMKIVRSIAQPAS